MVSWSKIARRGRVPLGFAVAGLYMWLAEPIAVSLVVGAMFIIPGLLIRALASGHVQKNERLAMTGPYAYTRNPLYLGSFIIATGFAFAARSWWFIAVLVVLLLAIYLPVIRAEEAFLALHFPEFAEYARRVPRLVPGPAPPGMRRGEFSWDLYKQHREYNATLGAVAITAALIIKLLWLS